MPAEPRGVQPESDLQWLDLADFSAGIYDYTSVSTQAPNVPGPKGAADPYFTHSCIALPGGGLGPLPAVAQEYTWTPTAYPTNYIVGLLVHDELSNGDTEVFVIQEADNGTTHIWQPFSYIAETTTFTAAGLGTSEPSAAGIFGSPYPQLTRAAATDPTTTPGNPVIVYPNGGPSSNTNTATGQLWMYPNPATPTSYTPLALITGPPYTSVSGQVLVHQSRVVVLAGITYMYPAGGGFDTNENINFTDPPNSTDYGNQMTVLAAEEPYGYGCGASISAGELMLIKKRGGGIVVTGDIFAPNVTFLPGVQPTGGIYGSAHSGLPGMIYCSFDNGAWSWNGGSTSQKISSQLDDSFFLPSVFSAMESNNYGFYCRCIGDKVYFSMNWLYDTRTNSWWRYYADATQGGADLFWVQEVDGQQIYAAPLQFTSSDLTFLYRFDQTVPSETWQWQGLPIRLTTNRFVELREVVVRASTNSGNTAATVKVSIYQGATEVGSVTTPASILAAPTMIRMPIGSANAGGNVYTGEDLTIRITALGNSAAAPNVHSVSLGYKQIAKAETVGVSS